jgi:hypothetical protein
MKEDDKKKSCVNISSKRDQTQIVQTVQSMFEQTKRAEEINKKSQLQIDSFT